MVPHPPQRLFGATGLTVPALGLGAGHIGGSNVDDAGVDALLGAALDAGVTPIRFAAFQPGVSTAIVGTAQAAHLRRAAESVATGPLPEELAHAIRASFRRSDRGWVGQV